MLVSQVCDTIWRSAQHLWRDFALYGLSVIGNEGGLDCIDLTTLAFELPREQIAKDLHCVDAPLGLLKAPLDDNIS